MRSKVVAGHRTRMGAGRQMEALSSCRPEREELLGSTDIWATNLLDSPACDRESCLYFDHPSNGCGLIRHGLHWRIERDGLVWLLSRRVLSPAHAPSEGGEPT